MRKNVWTRAGTMNAGNQNRGTAWLWVLGFFGLVLIGLLVLFLVF